MHKGMEKLTVFLSWTMALVLCVSLGIFLSDLLFGGCQALGLN